MDTGGEVDAFAASWDVEGLIAWMREDPQRVQAAIAWLAAHPGEFTLDFERANTDRDWWYRAPWFEAAVVLASATPAVAARSVAWDRLQTWEKMVGSIPSTVRDLLGLRGRQWCTQLMTRLAPTWTLSYEMFSPLVRDLELEVPEGNAYVWGWLAALSTTPRDQWLELVLSEPATPKLVENYLASDLMRSNPPVLPALPPLVAAGVLERAWLLGRCLELVMGGARPAAQREVAGLLLALEVTLGDLPGGVSYAQTLLAAAHGSVAAVILPLLLQPGHGRDVVLEAAASVAARPEKGMKQTLLRFLKQPVSGDTLGRGVVVEAATLLGEGSDDARLATQCAALVTKLTGSRDHDAAAPSGPTTQPRLGLWWMTPPAPSGPVPQPVPAPAPYSDAMGPTMATELRDGLTGTRGRERHQIDVERAVDGLVRVGLTHPQAVRVWVEKAVGSCVRRPGAMGQALAAWHHAPGPDGYAALWELVGTLVSYDVWDPALPWALREVAASMHLLRTLEALGGLGEVPALLATPTRTDYTLDLDALIDRVRTFDGRPAGPLDLLQALLRLGPVEPTRAGDLVGLTLPLRSPLPATHPLTRTMPTDGAEVIRGWVAAGGLPQVTWAPVTVPHNGTWWGWQVELPAPAGLLAFAPPGLLDAAENPFAGEGYAPLVPAWPDVSCFGRYYLPPPGRHSQDVDRIVRSRRPFGLPVYDQLLSALVAPRDRDRDWAIELWLDLLGDDRFDAETCAEVARLRMDAAVLPLARLTRALEAAASAGALSRVWPFALRLAEHACTAERVPPGTADLLRWMADIVPEVPAPVMPSAVTALAARAGSTKAHHEAKRLVAAALVPA